MATREYREGRPAADGIRQCPFALRAKDEDDEDTDGWRLDGYGAVFNRQTKIDSWEGIFMEEIANGSMRKSFRENPPIVQFDHGRHPLIGSFPIAELKDAREDTDPDLAPDGGAHIIADIFRHLFFEPLREAIAVQAVKGMSFRFSVVREKWFDPTTGKTLKDDEQIFDALRKTWRGDLPDEELPVRTLQELRVPEMGPVVWPAYTDTSVGVRDQVINLAELDTDPDQRMALARKLWAMPKLGAAQADEAPRSTDTIADQLSDGSAGEHSDSETRRAAKPQVRKPAGEHPSPTSLQQRSIRTELNQRLARARDTILNIETKGFGR